MSTAKITIPSQLLKKNSGPKQVFLFEFQGKLLKLQSLDDNESSFGISMSGGDHSPKLFTETQVCQGKEIPLSAPIYVLKKNTEKSQIRAVARVDRLFLFDQRPRISSSLMDQLISHRVLVMTCEGRIILGILHSFDQTLNLTLEQAVERIYSLQHSVEQVPLDVMVIRGENVCLVGELNEHLDSAIDFSKMYVEPIKECKV